MQSVSRFQLACVSGLGAHFQRPGLQLRAGREAGVQTLEAAVQAGLVICQEALAGAVGDANLRSVKFMLSSSPACLTTQSKPDRWGPDLEYAIAYSGSVEIMQTLINAGLPLTESLLNAVAEHSPLAVVQHLFARISGNAQAAIEAAGGTSEVI